MEIFDLYDSSMNKLHKTMERGGTNLPGEYFPVVHVWISNPNKEFLIQKRNKSTDLHPHQWATTSGAVISNETPIQGAIREVKEELGLSFLESDFKLLRKIFVDNDCCNHVVFVYLVQSNVLLNQCIIDTVEVQEITYKRINEIKQMIIQNEFWNYPKFLQDEEYFKLLEKGEL
jgi:8-oxo-dGTP pyrophosphatase MutT (NUDIX family)